MATTNFSLVLAPLDELDEELDDELEELSRTRGARRAG